jgi:DNA ligase-1
VIAFAALLEGLVFTQSRLAKIALLRRYFATQPDPDRGWGLAAVAGGLVFPQAKAGMIRALAAERTDPVLFALSYDFVGDLAETVALMWPAAARNAASGKAGPPGLAEVVETLLAAPKPEIPGIVARWLDASDASVRLALLKLVTGGLRVGASARLARVALAEIGEGVSADDIEEVWHSLAPPYAELFAWLEGRGARPDPADAPVFRPPMLAHPLEEGDVGGLEMAGLRAEWKWDGIRVQLVSTAGGRRLYSRGAEDISGGFPEIVEAMTFAGVLDGELLVVRDGAVAPFADLQQRLNRKSVGAKLRAGYPVEVMLYDMLFDGAEDIRGLKFDARRGRLEAWFARVRPARMRLSELIRFDGFEELRALRAGARAAAVEGLMLKRGESAYLPGRPRGLWWKWKRDPLTLDAVLMYAQRGHGRRSGSFSDYTFGVWREDGVLVPVGKAYFGFTDRELGWLDKWIREHTVAKFGPVREVEQALVLEVAFDAAQRSSRHKSGVALRFPRISRLRTDKPAAEADRLETVMRLADG